jgi:hypothetical protein
MTLRITKAMALEAIRTEPLLKAGSWAAVGPVDQLERVQVGDEKVCHVCAVGAVLRDVLDPGLSFRVIRDVAVHQVKNAPITGSTVSRAVIESQARELVDRGRIWNALSVLFEGYDVMRLYQTPEFPDSATVRREVCSFVEAEFPDDWELDLDPSLLRPGVAKEVIP